MDADTPTGGTLFNVIARPDDPRGWEQFVLRYGPRVNAWCRQQGLQEADAEDVLQNVLVRLFRHIALFRPQRDGSFRAYLRKVAANVVYDHRRATGRRGVQATGDSWVQGILESVAAKEELAHRLDQEIDREIFEAAAARVRARVEPHTWEAFRLTALEGLSGAEAALRLGLQRATVYVARGKVTRMLAEEIGRLEQTGLADGVSNE
jgi:RNA polymerase sigma-70 factor (ECF subfamily)